MFVPEDLRSTPEAESPTSAPLESPDLTELLQGDDGTNPRDDATSAETSPSNRRHVKVLEQRDPHDHRPRFEEDASVGNPILPGSTEEDDDRPYAVPGTGLKKCRYCSGELPLEAVFCVHCGKDLSRPKKKKPRRRFPPVSEVWEEGLPFRTRIIGLALFQVMNFILLALGMISSGESLTDFSTWVTNIVLQLFNILLQVFIIGSYDTLRLDRTVKGKTRIIRVRRIGFIPLPEHDIDWHQSHAVGVVGTHDPGIAAWFLCVYLLLLGCLPGIIFFFVVIRPERYSVALADEYGGVGEMLFRCKSRDWAEEIGRLIAETAHLKYRPVL